MYIRQKFDSIRFDSFRFFDIDNKKRFLSYKSAY